MKKKKRKKKEETKLTVTIIIKTKQAQGVPKNSLKKRKEREKKMNKKIFLNGEEVRKLEEGEKYVVELLAIDEKNGIANAWVVKETTDIEEAIKNYKTMVEEAEASKMRTVELQIKDKDDDILAKYKKHYYISTTVYNIQGGSNGVSYTTDFIQKDDFECLSEARDAFNELIDYEDEMQEMLDLNSRDCKVYCSLSDEDGFVYYEFTYNDGDNQI